ncbi:MAG: glycosyltransferase family 4 protein [Gemmatimonadaceae bacterium]|nr:glycosyltransferase family 4 protein [Gemmatimonadaceae bacterium]
MKILHTSYDDPRNPWLGGGGAARTFEICRRLAGRHEITVVCGSYPGAAPEEEVDGLRVLHLGSPRSYAISRLTFSARASRFLARSDADLWVYSFSAFAPLWASAPRRRASVLEFFHLMQEHAARKRPVLGLPAAAIERATLRAYDRVIAISPSVAEGLAAIRGDCGLHLVYTGVDDRCFLEGAEEGDYVLYFGRLDTYTKGLDLLLEAFGRVASQERGIRLVVAGRGTPERVAELRELARRAGVEERVELIGPVSAEEKTQLFRRSLFNVAPSRYEGWCIAAVEASAAGKAVVGTRIPGLVDAVRDGETGLLAEAEDVEGIAGAMLRLLREPGLRAQLGAAGRGWAQRFRWDRIADEQERVYEGVAAVLLGA